MTHSCPSPYKKWLELTFRRTGVTGYIGGDVLYGITQALASASIVALVRNEARAAAVTEKFSSVTPLIGDLDSTVEIRQEAQRADVILSTVFVLYSREYTLKLHFTDV